MKKRSILGICEYFPFCCDTEIGRKGNFSRWPYKYHYFPKYYRGIGEWTFSDRRLFPETILPEKQEIHLQGLDNTSRNLSWIVNSPGILYKKLMTKIKNGSAARSGIIFTGMRKDMLIRALESQNAKPDSRC